MSNVLSFVVNYADRPNATPMDRYVVSLFAVNVVYLSIKYTLQQKRLFPLICTIIFLFFSEYSPSAIARQTRSTAKGSKKHLMIFLKIRIKFMKHCHKLVRDVRNSEFGLFSAPLFVL